MEGQRGEEDVDSIGIGGPHAEWVVERARTVGISPSEYLERVLISVRAAEAGDPLDDLASAEEFERLADHVDSLDADLDEMIEDVRRRVIQVKRETDEKAPEDHEHPDLEATIEELERTVTETTTRAEAIGETVESIEEDLQQGFENYEEILNYVVDATDDLTTNTETIGKVLITLRKQLAAVSATEQRRRATDQLKATANTEGVTSAICESCDAEVDISLLSEPACPFCNASFADVRPKNGFFGSATLETGSPPALEGSTDDDEADLDAVVEETGDVETLKTIVAERTEEDEDA